MKYANQIAKETIDKLAAMADADPVRFKEPHHQKGPFVPRDDTEFWCYKCWVNQLETAEKGYDLEPFFANMDLHFDLPEGFVPESSLSVSHASDLMAVDCINDQYTDHIFDDIKDFYLTTDLPTANLESCVYTEAPFGRNQPPVLPGETKTKCSPRMNTSVGMLDKFVNAGIKYFSMANNHCFDYDEVGLIATYNELEKRGVAHSGTHIRPEDYGDVLIMEVNGVKIAQLSSTFDINGRECNTPWMIDRVGYCDNPANIDFIKMQVRRAKEQGADMIVLHAHWGWEFEMYPRGCTVELGHRLAELGIDVIVGTHPHVAQPMEKYVWNDGGEQRQTLIFYSMGDFVSYHPVSHNSRVTFVARYNAVKGRLNGKERVCISDLQILPLYILAAADENEDYDFRVLRLSTVLNDKPDANGKYQYGLVDWEREDLPRLQSRILHGILLPKDCEYLLAEKV